MMPVTRTVRSWRARKQTPDSFPWRAIGVQILKYPFQGLPGIFGLWQILVWSFMTGSGAIVRCILISTRKALRKGPCVSSALRGPGYVPLTVCNEVTLSQISLRVSCYTQWPMSTASSCLHLSPQQPVLIISLSNRSAQVRWGILNAWQISSVPLWGSLSLVSEVMKIIFSHRECACTGTSTCRTRSMVWAGRYLDRWSIHDNSR